MLHILALIVNVVMIVDHKPHYSLTAVICPYHRIQHCHLYIEADSQIWAERFQ